MPIIGKNGVKMEISEIVIMIMNSTSQAEMECARQELSIINPRLVVILNLKSLILLQFTALRDILHTLHTSYFLLHYSLFEFKRLCPGLDYPLFLVVYEAGVDQRWLKRLVYTQNVMGSN